MTTEKVKKHKSPNPDPAFTREWNRLIPFVTSKKGFHSGHLSQLEILCDLYVEYKKLKDVLEITGHTFMSEGGRNGKQIKYHPEVAQLNKCRTDIAAYSKLLGIFITDKSAPVPELESKEDESWE